MIYLLDTHTFIWWHNEPEKLSGPVRNIFQDSQNVLYLSLASIWEIQIKVMLGKLKFTTSLREIIEKEQELNRIQLFPILLEHILNIETLPAHHKDPFDRLLIAQSILEQIPLITDDPVVVQYPITTLW